MNCLLESISMFGYGMGIHSSNCAGQSDGIISINFILFIDTLNIFILKMK